MKVSCQPPVPAALAHFALDSVPLPKWELQAPRQSGPRSAELSEFRSRGAENLRRQRKWQGPGCPRDGHSPLEGDWRVVACHSSTVSPACSSLPLISSAANLHSIRFPVSALFLVLSVS